MIQQRHCVVIIRDVNIKKVFGMFHFAIRNPLQKKSSILALNSGTNLIMQGKMYKNSQNIQFLKEKANFRMNFVAGPAIELQCQIHKDQVTAVRCGADFSKVAAGGCSLICNQELSCGHCCKSMCHVNQDYHRKLKCKEPCRKSVHVLSHVNIHLT